MDDQQKYRTADYYNGLTTITYYDDEIFKPYPLREGYMVGNRGTIFSEHYQKKIHHVNDQKGYETVSLGKTTRVHRAVLITHGPEPGPGQDQVNHIDGNKHNNNFYGVEDPRTNLEWCTPQENTRHAHAHGLCAPLGLENHPKAKYSNELIEKVCQCLELGYTARQVAEAVNYPYSLQFKQLITDIKGRHSWAKISCKYNIHVRPYRRKSY